MANELIINASLPETRIALMEEGEIQDLLIERASDKGIVGNIYKGRVTRVLPGMQAAFVDIGLEKAAFLYVDDVFVHNEIFEEEEGPTRINPMSQVTGENSGEGSTEGSEISAEGASEVRADSDVAPSEASQAAHEAEAQDHFNDLDEEGHQEGQDDDEDHGDHADHDDDEDDQDDEDNEPAEMAPPPGEGEGDGDENAGNRAPQGTIKPREPREASDSSEGEQSAAPQAHDAGAGPGDEAGPGRRRHRRGRRGGKFRSKRGRDDRGPETGKNGPAIQAGRTPLPQPLDGEPLPESYNEQVSDNDDHYESDRSVMGSAGPDAETASNGDRPQGAGSEGIARVEGEAGPQGRNRQEFRAQRGRDRRIKVRSSMRPPRAQANIQDLLKEGQEVLVQVAKDPIATKGARLTCHISLPGRHLVCMPTIDHVGVSRRIERDDERRRLREYVEKNRPRGLGFIVRTASGKSQSEQRIKQDVDYLARLWDEIREKAANSTAPALVYEDLNSVLRAIRDWVTEEIDKIIVDSRYHFNDIQRFVSHFMPSLKSKIELYHGDVPIFDAYGISTELSRALERKVWLKSGGYIVVDQAEALVAIDVNTGRYVGKKNLEDTILKTNLEAVQEIAYQLRLRNCGGIIILDLIDMEREENKHRVYRALEEALKKDRARPSILKISELGLVEMTRKRTRDTMVRALCESCNHCEGKGFIKSKQTVAYEVLREIERTGIDRDVNKILVQANPDVIDILAIDERETLDQIERRYHRQIYLQAVGDMHAEQFEVSSDKKEGASRERVESRFEGRGGDRNRGRNDRNRSGGSGGGGRDRNRKNSEGGGQRDRGERGDRSGPNPNAPIVPRTTLIAPLPVAMRGPIPPPPTSDFSEGENLNGGEPVQGQGQDLGSDNDMRGNSAVQKQGNSDDFFENEEDRLAFLRAQAAQDAALARLNSGQAGAVGRPGGGVGGPGRGGDRDRGGGRGGRNNRRGRSGKFGGRDRGPGPGRGDRPMGFGPRGGGGRGPQGDGGGNTGGQGEGGGGGAPSGGGGDSDSQPPV